MKKKKNFSVVEKISKVLQEYESSRIPELENLIQVMTQKGLLKKQSFGLPLVDTVGKSAYAITRTETSHLDPPDY